MLKTNLSFLTIVICVGALACGGTKPTDTGVGQSHADDLDVDTDGDGVPDTSSSALGDAGTTDAAPPPAPVTFVIKNTHSESLFLNMDRGWQPVISAYSGQPPNAQSILMFPTHCTMGCDTPPEEICPVCEEPERVQDIKAAQTLDEVKPGESREVPWDLMVHVDEKTSGVNEKGKKTRCKCWKKEPAPPETYTVMGCGLRLTQTAKQSSKLQCEKTEMIVPEEPGDPVVVEIEFAEPQLPTANTKKGKKGKRP